MLFFVNSAIADERKTVFEGLDTKIVSILDDMTDEESGVIFLDLGPVSPIYMAIYGHDHFIIWANTNDLYFAFDRTHLIRVGKNKPFPLKSLSKRNGLKPTNTKETESVVESLVKGEEIKIRFYNWPQYDKFDQKIQNPNLAFVYNKAVKQFGWKDFGIPAKLAPVKLDIYIPTDPDTKGYATLSVIGNRDLGLKKGFDKHGGGCYVTIGEYKELFGTQKGKWCCSEVDSFGRNRIIIRNSQGKIVFEGKVPHTYSSPKKGNRWPLGAKAAKAAWESAPLGSIEIEGIHGKRVLLYGFKELWEWGVDNAGFPSLE